MLQSGYDFDLERLYFSIDRLVWPTQPYLYLALYEYWYLGSNSSAATITTPGISSSVSKKGAGTNY